MELTDPTDVEVTPRSDRDSDLAREKVRAELFGQPMKNLSVGRFVVLEQVGAGGMGEVYAAYDPELDRRVAVKLLGEAHRKSARARLLREAKAMAAVSHPNVATIYEAGLDGDRVFIAMEFLDGPTLDEWAKKKRTWREIVAKVILAGRGLDAAHRAGLVHRDFKPANVMLTELGEPRVLDFGLVRRDGDSIDSSDSEHQGPPSGEQRLTQTGAVMGTPAYMAPELFDGAVASVRSDQFAFCVTLHELLYGSRPFHGKTLSELIANVSAGRPIAEPAGRALPAALRAVILRGISKSPGDRFESMGAVLAALSRIVAPPGRAWGLGVATVLGAGAVSAAWWFAEAEPNPCVDAQAQLDAVWGDTRREEVRDAFAHASERGPASATRVAKVVDEWGARWVRARRDLCRDENADRARLRCFDHQLRRADALLGALVPPSEDAIDRAVAAVDDLPGPDACADSDWLRRAVPMPDDPAQREAAERVRLEIDRAWALKTAGRRADAVAAAQDAHASAVNNGYGPVEVEALVELGDVYGRAGEFDKTSEALEQAVFRARAVGHDIAQTQATHLLLWNLGVDQRKPEAAIWARWAEAELERGGAQSQTAPLLSTLGLYALQQRDLDVAHDYLRRAFEYDVATRGSRSYAVASSANNLSAVLEEMGRLDEALEFTATSLEVSEGVLGERHPFVVSGLLGRTNVLVKMERYDEARLHILRAADLARDVLGEDSITYARTIGTLSNIDMRQGQLQDAEKHQLMALEVLTGRLGEHHANVGVSLNTLGVIAKQRADYTAARDYYDRALAVFRHPDVADTNYEKMVLRNIEGMEEAQAAD